MIQALMALALRERAVVIGAAVLLLLAGLYSFTQLDIEAYPDPVQPMTEVLTLPNGLSAEEVEKLVTVPTEYGMSGMLHLTAMESISLYGLSDVRLYFDWDSDYEVDRIQTINQLQFITLPQGIQAGLSPENPIGEIYRYTVRGPDHDLVKEKASRGLDLSEAVQDRARRARRLGLWRSHQRVPRRSGPAETRSLLDTAYPGDQLDSELEHEFRRKLSQHRRTGIRCARAWVDPRAGRHRQRRAHIEQVDPDQDKECGRRVGGLGAAARYRRNGLPGRGCRGNRPDAEIRQHA